MNAIRKMVAVLAALSTGQALLVSDAAAKPVTLSCQSDAGAVWTLRIDYATGLVERLAPSGAVYKGWSATASVSDNAIVWSKEFQDEGTAPPSTMHWEGNIDRLPRTGSFREYRPEFYHYDPVSVTCSEATPKF